MKLIQTKDYLLLIDEESRGIEFGEIGVNMRHSNLEPETRNIGGYGSDKFYWSHKKIIAYYPLNSETKELELPLLPNPLEDKFEELFDTVDGIKVRYSTEESDLWVAYRNGFKDCFEAQSKQFSLDDMKKAIEMAREQYEPFHGGGGLVLSEPIYENKYTSEEIIQSLSTQQLPISFEPEYINTNSFGSETNGYDSGNFVLKTIINSEGKEELVGTYKY